MVNHCCIQYCKQDNAGLGKKFRLSSDPSIRQSWIEVIEKVNGGKLKVSQATIKVSILSLKKKHKR